MKIHRIRLGFATNSSSSHSIIVCDKDPRDMCLRDDYDKGEYDWSDFTIIGKEGKLHYFGLLVYYNVLNFYNQYRNDESINKLEAAQFTRDLIPEVEFEFEDESIDHQSRILFPNSRDETGYFDFIRNLKRYFMNDHVAILGGNDNDGEHWLAAKIYEAEETGKDVGAENSILMGASISNTILRKENDSVWTIFNKMTGNTHTFSFDDVHSDSCYPEYPELVDLKITNWCDKGCKYCYQNSTTRGSHAEYDNVINVLEALEKLKVFEVAIGGGEPTAHPRFHDILRCSRLVNNIIPNFSTRNLKCFDDFGEYDKLGIGACAISIDSSNDIVEIEKEYFKSTAENHSCNLSIHIVAASIKGREEKENILQCLHELNKTVNINTIVLLGYKDKGRGKTHRTKEIFDSAAEEREWMDCYMEYYKKYEGERWRRVNLSVDTCFAKNVKEDLRKFGVSEKLYDTEEGIRSLYIDTVSMVMGASSFVPDEELVPINIENVYESIQSFWNYLKSKR